jgi:murein DD-endopeptidase MepM/ murein hydrolase activator NlpD
MEVAVLLKRVTAWAALVAGLLLMVLLQVSAAHGQGPSAPVAKVQAPARWTGGQHFLTLPFNDPNIVVQNGWLYNYGSLHYGTDFILGERDTGKWQSFDVVAAADGWACGNCTSRQGNAVWIKHVVNGQTYYTYYGHLATIDPSIPLGDQKNTVWVTRGQKIGDAGSTGADVIHLHFQVNLPSGPVDPFDLWSTREPYMPGCATCQLGPNNLWSTNPPSFASGAQTGSGPAEIVVPTTPTPGAQDGGPTSDPVDPIGPTATATRVRTATATRTPAPTATATPVPCTLPYEKTVEGTITDAKPSVTYCLAGTAGDWVSIRMFAAQGSTVDTYLKVFSPDGKVFATDDDGAQIGGNSFLVKRLPKSGTYKVVATRYSGTGAYHLRVERGSKSALGDINRDCIVNQDDVQMLNAMVGTGDPNGDLNMDGVVDAQDQLIQNERLGRGCMLGMP